MPHRDRPSAPPRERGPAERPPTLRPQTLRRPTFRAPIFRVLGALTLLSGLQYLVWRYTSTLNLEALWFAIPMIVAETYSLIGAGLFVINLWRPLVRKDAPPLPEEQWTVDVFIPTYNEPVALVRRTVDAAMRIRWPALQVYLLDDGGRAAIAEMARELGCGYISRGDEWAGKPRHAKAGNVDNALLQTTGQYIVILDCDQIPDPRIVERTIGYMRDERVAFVQTPQHFYNIPPGDPFGTDASFFYGPIQEGKDGWNAAFFCGSNALLRREALMQLALIDYATEMEARVQQRLRALEHHLARAHRSQHAGEGADVLELLEQAVDKAHHALDAGAPLETVSDMIRRAVAKAQEDAVRADLAEMARDLRELASTEGAGDSPAAVVADQLPERASEVAAQAPPVPESVGLPSDALRDLDLARADEAIPVLGLPTFSITEDMALALRLHAKGWRSVYHNEVLAQGLAPEDLGAALQQRLRWAQGTIQILIHEKPLRMKGLSLIQRLQYMGTIYNYFGGFFSVIYLLAPIVYLCTGITPVSTLTWVFVWRLVPYLLLNRALVAYGARGISTWRGEQYALALFPVWIRAVVSVASGARPRFAVTPKQRQSGNYLALIWPQLGFFVATLAAIVVGLVAQFAPSVLLLGQVRRLGATLTSVFWGGYNLVALWVIVRAALYRPPADWRVEPPDFDSQTRERE